MYSIILGLLLCICYSSHVEAAYDIGFASDDDLTSFVTRPEIKAPKFNVNISDGSRVEEGYWFVGPYANVNQERHAARYYQPCQTGMHIYDGNGDLIWSGACMFQNQNAVDFKVVDYNGTDYLTAILWIYKDDIKGHAIIMDNSYRLIQNVYTPKQTSSFNMHEFNIMRNGTHAIHLLTKREYVDASDLRHSIDEGWILDNGIRELNVRNGETVFEWWARDHIALSESTALANTVARLDHLRGPWPVSWDWFHANSLDKNSEGDYLLSARHTDCIYKISGMDGRILWRLGGTNSSFDLDFNFSRQHDARWLHHDDDTETISFLNNAADEDIQSASVSSGLIVQLDKRTMTGRTLEETVRPDGALSRLRGSFQTFASGNVFAGWSDNCYITEHDAAGRLLMEARFQSERFVTYRAYKFNFTARPVDPPDLKAFAYGTSLERAVTVCYVSWNGATEVSSWRFWSASTAKPILIGESKKSGFETVFQSDGFESVVYAEALSVDGTVLGTTSLYNVAPPPLSGRSLQDSTILKEQSTEKTEL